MQKNNFPNHVHLLGLAPSAIAIQLSTIPEIIGDCLFHIYKNIEVDKDPILFIKPDTYPITIHNLGEVPTLESKTKNYIAFGVPGPKAKIAVFNYFKKAGKITQPSIHTFIHPTAYVASEVIVGNGVFIEPKVIVSTQTKIGFGTTIKRGVSVGHHNKLGTFCELNPGVILSGNVVIGDNCIIGTGTTVKDGITIGNNSFIGMGSNVVKNMPSGVVAYGNPCKVMKNLNV